MNSLPKPSVQLAHQLIETESRCVMDWMKTLAALPGNPFDAGYREFGKVVACVCGKVPAQVFNRVFNLTSEDHNNIPAILEYYREHSASPTFDLNPYTTAPFWTKGNLPIRLAQQGFMAGYTHMMLYGVPTSDIPALPPTIRIVPVDHSTAQLFSDVYETVWGSGQAISVLIDHPNFDCFLAFVDDKPAALGVLHVTTLADGTRVGSMANALTNPKSRNRGCQTALLYHRIQRAAELKCDLMVSQAAAGSTSQSNQLRVGFQIAGTKSWWMPVKDAVVD